ncbi:MAG: hypothetical protein GX359_01565 [Clostridiales bacterium]|nr:hypothetical protein [Clostridiales bacterium]
MKKKPNKLLITVFAVLFVLTSFVIQSEIVKADDTHGQADAIIISEMLEKDALVLKPGATRHMLIPIKAINYYMDSAHASIDVGDAPFTVSNVILSQKGNGIPVYGVSNYGTTYVEFDLTVKETATIGNYPVTINVTAYAQRSYTLSLDLDFSITKELAPAQISLSDVSVRNAMVGEDTLMLFKIRNEGEVTALNTYISFDYGETGITPLYDTPKVKVGDLAAGMDRYMSLPIQILPTAEEGLKTVTLNVDFKNVDGESDTNTHDIFIDVKKKDNAPSIVVEGITFEGILERGNKVSLIADIKNYGETLAKDIRVKIDETASDGFGTEGLIKDYYTEDIWVGSIKPENSRQVIIPLTVSKQATGGLKTLTLGISYVDEAGTEYSTKASLYADVIVEEEEDEESKVSKPKLIVSKYTTDVEELRAGSTFNFTFDLYNTHSSIAAKNITVTVSQAENIFSPTQGSNSFFISKINPGETVQSTLEMKVKADTKTKAYPLKLTVEYEYDGIKANPATGEVGETEEIELSLQAVENSRPVVDYINVYSWDSWDGSISVGSPATLAFEFYNMGKSPLNNVIATVEGDFVKSDGNMYFIGNVPEGSATYVEFEVIPNIEGMAKGLVKITFEDSNGDEIEYSKDFEAMISGSQMMDPGMGMDPGFEDVFNPMVPEVKKEIVPMWLFIVILVAIFIIFVPVSRKVIISVYKQKLRRNEFEEI